MVNYEADKENWISKLADVSSHVSLNLNIMNICDNKIAIKLFTFQK